MQLLDFNPKERISIEKILNMKEIQKINYEKKILNIMKELLISKTPMKGGVPKNN